MNAIETTKLTKNYGKARGITDVDLCVKEGDFFGFIGPNGAGKSTLIRTLLGLLSPTSGEARVLGLDAVRDKTEILKKVGYLPAEPTVYGNMKVADVIRFSAKLRGGDYADEAARIAEILKLDTSRRVKELSLGNRKKLGIVCAMQHRPALYVMDEPTSGLDPLIKHEFFSLLAERNAEGATVFLSSHNLDEVTQYCKTAAIIKGGQLLVADAVENLVKTDAKRVTLTGLSGDLPTAHVRDMKTDNDTVSFLFDGGNAALLAMLAKLDFKDFTVGNTEFDRVFLHYYEEEEK